MCAILHHENWFGPRMHMDAHGRFRQSILNSSSAVLPGAFVLAQQRQGSGYFPADRTGGRIQLQCLLVELQSFLIALLLKRDIASHHPCTKAVWFRRRNAWIGSRAWDVC